MNAGKVAGPMASRPRGTRDFDPDEMARRRAAEARMREVFRIYSYKEVQTPTFEELELFTAKSGDGIISELYDFEDKGGRRMTLRPELTAPVMRMYYADHAFDPKPIKWFYFGNCFRYDRPQAGRYREFWQFGCEQIGAGTPVAYAELIALARGLLDAVGIKGADVRVGHVGILRAAVDAAVPDDARAQAMRLIDKAAPEALAEHLAKNDVPGDRAKVLVGLTEGRYATLDDARKALEWLDADDDFDELAQVLEHAQDKGIDARPHLGIARGLDYYTGVVFEIHSPALGAQSQLVGGGGYDLSAVFGGQATPTIGFGLGFDRTLVALEAEGAEPVQVPGPAVYFGALGEQALGVVTRGAAKIRGMGLAVDMDLIGRKPGQIAKAADAAGARFLVIIGDRDLEAGQIQAKDLADGSVQELPIEGFADWLVEQTGGIDLRDYN